MHFHRRLSRASIVAAVAVAVVAVGIGVQGAADARNARTITKSQCYARPWTNPTYQSLYSHAALADDVLTCLKDLFPTTFRHDEVGIVALNSYPWFQNVNEFGLTSTVQKDIAYLGLPPITLQDGPEGLITKTSPSPTSLPNDLALGATFDTSLASLYGTVLGAQAHGMGYDGVQAPNLNLTRVPSWGRASESFGESPVLAGEMGAAEVVALENQHVIPIIKHFGPYSQETDRKGSTRSSPTRPSRSLPATVHLRAARADPPARRRAPRRRDHVLLRQRQRDEGVPLPPARRRALEPRHQRTRAL